MIFTTILIDATLTSRKNDIFNMSVCLNDCHKKSTDTRKLQEKMFIVYINLLSFGAFFIIVASINLRQLFLQEIWKYIDLNGDVTKWQIITIVSLVKLIVYYTSFF